jgi:hypothetical protein
MNNFSKLQQNQKKKIYAKIVKVSKVSHERRKGKNNGSRSLHSVKPLAGFAL